MPAALGEGATRCRAPTFAESPPSIAEDWRIFKTSGSVTSRDRLVAYYMSTHVRPIAVRVYSGLPHGVDLEDLMQQGYLGLIDAMNRFELDRNTRFETFSRSRIFGAVQDYLRSIDPVPRLTRTRSKRVEEALERFVKRHGRRPTTDDLRKLLDLPEPWFRRALADHNPAAMVPFSHVHPEGGAAEDPETDAMDAFEDASEPGPLMRASQRDLRRWLTRSFDRRDRLIIILYYYEELTMREIAGAVGISESRVSQRLETILACLRSRLVNTGAEREFLPA